MIATVILTTVGSGIYSGTVTSLATGATLGIFLLGPMSWWLYKSGRLNANSKPANIFYENGVTPEEIERIQNIDAIECAAY